MDYEFITTCATCRKDFTILWMMDQIRVGLKSIARISCPVCRERFYQKASNLIPFKGPRRGLLIGRPVRTVELIYDCPSCGMRGISMTPVYADFSWEDLVKETSQTAVCNNYICSRKGLQQKVKPGR